MKYLLAFVDVDGASIEIVGDEHGSEIVSDGMPFVPSVGDRVSFIATGDAYRVVAREFIYGGQEWAAIVTLEDARRED
ncbi:hypothetical protein [Paludisphaera mucosa]|uniref:Uncharacterized protein n=1 Tax=Paludisphaera mucosa TaxID=3030827 RepID=A0ABT6FLS6_9BACT|nr:hypothetical protein [Paludisphaera mucosa]MDG3008521.1 hypothetical protein [Paludisphaera mucosa]